MSAPKDWKKGLLGEECSIEIGGTPSRNVPEYWDTAKETANAWVSIRDLSRRTINSTAEHISDLGAKRSNVKLQSEGAVLLSFKLSIGRVAFAGIPLYTNEAIAGLRSESINHDFLYFGLQEWDLLQDVDQAIKGATLNKAKLKKIEFHYPPSKPEQTKIAEVLSTVDRAIEQTEALIAKQQRLKTGLMQDLLTCGIDEHGNLRSEQTHPFKDSPLGRIPAEWEVKQIKDVGLVVTGNTPSESAFADDYQSVPFITPADVGVTSAIQKTTRSFGKNSATSVRMIPAGSICVVCIGSTIGKIGVTVGEAASNQQINTVIPHESKTSEFLLHSMLLYLPSQLRKEAGLQAVPIVNKSTFERLLIAIPRDSKEAIEIQHQISSPSAIAESGTRTLVKLRALKTALMQDLLTGRKRVTAMLDGKESGT